MTLLAIDAGNTRIKWGIHDGVTWSHRGAGATAQAGELRQALSAVPAPRRIVIANVAGPGVQGEIGDTLSRFAVQPEWIAARAEQCGVRSSYAIPAQLGPDRWAALIAARNLYGGPCVVVNAGTTATVDALSAESIFLGGFIVPGYNLMRQTLSQNTARLVLQEGRVSFFPDNTGDAIASGAANAIAGAVERMIHFMADIAPLEPVAVLSGGDAQIIAPLLNARVELVDNLVLEGLLCIGASGVGA